MYKDEEAPQQLRIYILVYNYALHTNLFRGKKWHKDFDAKGDTCYWKISMTEDDNNTTCNKFCKMNGGWSTPYENKLITR